jgi:DNA modification methylase
MTPPLHTRRRWEVRHADCLLLLPRLDASSIDAVVTDPPYGISINNMSWDSPRRLDPMRAPTRVRSRTSPRMAFQGFCAEWATQCFRVLKPGAHLAAFSSPRTAHLLACGLEDAGFELRDQLVWLRGSGHPGTRTESGLATHLRPAVEPILLARKPLKGTLGSNLSIYGTGALNINASRIISGEESCAATGRSHRRQDRWPASLLLSHSPRCTRSHCVRDCPVELLGTRHRFFYCARATRSERNAGCEHLPRHTTQTYKIRAQCGARAKASPVANIHPTVKPLDLMRWLVRLLTPPRNTGDGAIVLDPFTGSGSTGAATVLEGARFLGVEREAAYVPIARARIKHWAKSNGGATNEQ